MTYRIGEIVHHKYRIDRVLRDYHPLALYYAADMQSHQMCILKQNKDTDSESASAYQQEIELISRLSLPCLPDYLDGFQEPGQGSMIAWGLVKGSLLSSMAANNAFPAATIDAVSWVLHLASCISKMHKLRSPVYHLEISPENTLITSTSQPFFIQMGLADIKTKALRKENLEERIIPGFSAPERYTSKPAIPHSDVYGLGALLYFLTTGQAPAAADLRYKGSRLSHPDELNPNLPHRLGHTIMNALVLDPAKRTSSVDGLIADLTEIKNPGRMQTKIEPDTVDEGEAVPQAQKGSRSLLWVLAVLSLIIIAAAAIFGPGLLDDFAAAEAAALSTPTITLTIGPSETPGPTRTLRPTHTPVTPSPTAVPATKTATATASPSPTPYYTATRTATIYPVGPFRAHLAPEFGIYTMNGTMVRLSDYLGQPVVVNFWASWCPPCREEMPGFQKVYEEFEDQGLVLLAVNAADGDSRTDAAEFIKDYGLTFPVIFDTAGDVQDDYRVISLPSTFFINELGLIESITVGSMDESQFRNAVQQIIP